MLLSMTGYGDARHQDENLTVSVEVRTINNRYFKLNARISEGYGGLESQIEAAVRGAIRRGTVQLNVRVERPGQADQYSINETVLAGYLQQLAHFQKRFHNAESVPIGQLLLLPGVVSEQEATGDATEKWPLIEKTLLTALAALQQMRSKEGSAMATDLAANLDIIAAELAAIQLRAPLVVEAYRTRLTERITKLLAEYDALAPESDIITEVGLFAERSDISEEIVRLASHIEQFRACIKLEESAGRKLDFVTQEMFRETNTIGSKSSDVEISRHVVEIKTAVERIREMVQNVE